MQLSTNFVLQEFVPPEIYSLYGDNSIWFLDQRIIDLAQALRDDLGVPITINNWHRGGPYKNSGFRLPSSTEGKLLSQHKYGRAIDPKAKGISPEIVRNHLRRNFTAYQTLGLTTIESDTPTWVHMDCRWTGLNTLFEVGYL